MCKHCVFGLITFLVAVAGLAMAVVTFLKLRECESCYDDFAFEDEDEDVPYFTADMTEGEDTAEAPAEAPTED